jgi:hypothetical protein
MSAIEKNKQMNLKLEAERTNLEMQRKEFLRDLDQLMS